jgi:hypothetical protein
MRFRIAMLQALQRFRSLSWVHFHQVTPHDQALTSGQLSTILCAEKDAAHGKPASRHLTLPSALVMTPTGLALPGIVCLRTSASLVNCSHWLEKPASLSFER